MLIEKTTDELSKDIKLLNNLIIDSHSIIKVLNIGNPIHFEEKYTKFSNLFKKKFHTPFAFISIDNPILTPQIVAIAKGSFRKGKTAHVDKVFGIDTCILARDKLVLCSFPKDRILLVTCQIKSKIVKLTDNSFGTINLIR